MIRSEAHLVEGNFPDEVLFLQDPYQGLHPYGVPLEELDLEFVNLL